MTSAAVCVPRWPDNGRRDEVWEFTRQWIDHNIGLPLHTGQDPGPGEARALAAQQATEADVLVFWDSDTLAHPEAVQKAIQRSLNENRMVLACDSHMYLSEASSDRIMSGGLWFPRPYDVGRNIGTAIYAKPCSGVYAIPRSLYEACGGYPAVGKWGYEDLVWFQLTAIVSGNSPDWVQDHITLHLWHPPAERTTTRHQETERNKALWQRLARIRTRPDALSQARQHLKHFGHEIP